LILLYCTLNANSIFAW